MKKLYKNLLALAILSVLLIPAASFAATLTTNDLGAQYIQNNIALGNRDPRTMIATLINTSLSILSIIAVVIILMGGFKWMTSMGNEDKVDEAKKLMGAGVIGLVIILAAWGISTFAMSSLLNATN
ncbi:MAG: pilin [Candidatus Falkowbacteria bacterium]